jgi:hypothetical protein
VDYTLALHLTGTGKLIGTERLALSTPGANSPNAGLRLESPAAQFGLAVHANRRRKGYGRETLGAPRDSIVHNLSRARWNEQLR